MTAQHSAGYPQVVAESRRPVEHAGDLIKAHCIRPFSMNSQSSRMLVAAVARAAAAMRRLVVAVDHVSRAEAPFLERHAQREEQRRAERMAHDARAARQKAPDPSPEIAREPIAQHLSKDFKLRADVRTATRRASAREGITARARY
jgi:hypothetical protein